MISDELHRYSHQGLLCGYFDIPFWVSLSFLLPFTSSQYRNRSPGLYNHGRITAPSYGAAGEDSWRASQIPGREGYIYF